MELRQLMALEAVLETGSFAAAARARHITQPALWAQVKGLEAELGVRLFVRAGRGVQPTPACSLLRPGLRVALDDVEAFAAHAREIVAGRDAPARIGTASSGVAYFFADCVAALRAERPDAPFPHIVPATLLSAVDLLVRGTVDLVAIPRSAAPGLEGFPLYDLWPCAVGRSVRGPTIDVRKLDDQPIATLPRDSGLRVTIEDAARNARVRLRVVHEDRDARTLLALARRGVCTSIVTNEVVEGADLRTAAEVVSGRTRFTMSLYLCWQQEAALSPAARVFRDVIHRVAKERRKRKPKRR